MTAIFAVRVAVGCEILPAGGAGEGIDRFSIDRLRVAVPPGSAAGIRAEFPGLLFWYNSDGLAALLAARGIHAGFTSKPVSAAERTNCIIRDTESLTDFCITDAL